MITNRQKATLIGSFFIFESTLLLILGLELLRAVNIELMQEYRWKIDIHLSLKIVDLFMFVIY
ncbi:hypothetical protein LGK95_02665 [Clostridium algoriphilum]|uniref:hypothetical protein n=1 Tax=Clostridium algoriphilum TaxID=198347 RepID=UPI001CF5E1CB|nr:hypothetical protein [Clostridium algoriphilum]MCB2292442.1 hypothetical protein [Clostridium algoriphilum]